MLNVRYLRCDVLGRLGGLVCKRLDLRSNHTKTTASFAGTRSLNRGIECKQVGLLRYGLNQLHHVADPARASYQLGDYLVGRLCDLIGAFNHRASMCCLITDIADRSAELLRCASHSAHVR